MKKVKIIRLVTIITSFVLLAGILSQFSVSAAYENTHVNTGNYAYDIVQVAKTQVGYVEGTNNDTKYNRWFGSLSGYGYNYAWCQTFVAWCANQAGVPTSMIPRVSGTISAKDTFKKNGTYHAGPYEGGSYTPKAGDIIYFYSSGSSSKHHVGIVSGCSNGTVYTIEGNSSNKVAERSYSVNYGNIRGYGVPFSEPIELVTPTIHTDKSSYTVGATVNISWEASPAGSNLSHYWLNIAGPNGEYPYSGTMDLNTSYSFVVSQAGNYTITTYATPKGSKEGEGSLTDSITISVSKPVWHAGLSPANVGSGFYAYIINVNSWNHLTNDNGNVATYPETGAANQIWKFDQREDGSYKITNCADGNVLDVVNFGNTNGTNVGTCGSNDDSAQRWFIYGSSGDYRFRAACTDCVMDAVYTLPSGGTNVETWTKNDNPGQVFQIWKLMPELSVEPGNKANLTTFNWDNFPGNDRFYDLKIWKGTLWEGNPYYIEWGLKETSYKIELPVGHYEAYVDTRIGKQILMNNIVKFDITEDYFGLSELKVVEGDKYTKTHFEWTPVEKAKFYDLKIWNGTYWVGDTYKIEWDITDTSIEIDLPSGYYEAYLDARSDDTIQMSNVISFNIKENYNPLDLNNDNKTTILDAVLLQKHLLNFKKLTAEQMKLADINSDGRVNILDMSLLKEKLK